MKKDYYFLECKQTQEYKQATPKAFQKKINALKYTGTKDEEKNESSELHFSKTIYLGANPAIRETISMKEKTYNFLSYDF